MRTIVVTGGATGIGFAIARRLAQQGDAVVLASRNLERLEAAKDRLESEGARCSAAVVDVRDGDAVERLIGSLPDIDGLVNNAAATSSRPRSNSARTASAPSPRSTSSVAFTARGPWHGAWRPKGAPA